MRSHQHEEVSRAKGPCASWARPGAWLFVLAVLGCGRGALARGAEAPAPQQTVERWGLFEVALRGPSQGNPFTDVRLTATFRQAERTVTVDGFYDGGGVYRVRFMPELLGDWTWVTESNVPALNGRRGKVRVAPARGANHGPVRVRDRFHFARADGTPYYPIGTTAYAWLHTPEAMQAQTLRTLAAAPFNKLRMLVFPKWYAHVRSEPVLFPYERDAAGRFDFLRPNPEFFRHLDRQVLALQALGIEADLILFHPYDDGHWGFDGMPAAANELYLRYVLARLGAVRSVWWSMANEWDLVKQKRPADWHRYLDLVSRHDPYRHLCSIHNGDIDKTFDHERAPISHVSIQHPEVALIQAWRERWGKPVVDDECEYEGDLEQAWGNLSPEELVHRFWLGTVRGGYVGHGETYQHPNDEIWWAKGGVLRGQSAPRIAFLRRFLEAHGSLEPLKDTSWVWRRYGAARQGNAVVLYLGAHRPNRLGAWTMNHIGKEIATWAPPVSAARYRVQILDTLNMRTEDLPGLFSADAEVALPARPGLVVRVTPVP